MATYRKVCCPRCQQADVKKNGKTSDDQQRYLCQNSDCKMKTFLLSEDYVYKGCTHHIEAQILTQKVERFFLTLRTHIKRLARKSICFSKSELMHDTVIGLYINKNYF